MNHKNWDDTDTHATPLVEKIIKQLEKEFSKDPDQKVDERLYFKMAKDAMLEMGIEKMQRGIKKLSLMRSLQRSCCREYLTAILGFLLQISDAIDGCLIILNLQFINLKTESEI